MMSYPEEENKGKYFGIFWSIFNCGAILGSVIPLGLEWHNGKSEVSTRTYVAIMVVMGFGSVLTLLLLPPTQVVRQDGSPVAIYKYSSCRTEATGILKLFLDWRILCLIPMFFTSNWFYTYQFNVVNGGGLFTTRTRALNGTLYWTSQILGSNLMGNLLDFKYVRRRTRAFYGLGVLFVSLMVIWGSGFHFQTSFTRMSVLHLPEADRIDIADSRRYAGPVVLYALYGLFDAIWQTYCYWLMGALTNDTQKAARFSGFYKAVQNAGGACAGQVDAKRTAFLVELVLNWVLCLVGVLCALPVAWSVQNTLESESKTAGAAAETPDEEKTIGLSSLLGGVESALLKPAVGNAPTPKV